MVDIFSTKFSLVGFDIEYLRGPLVDIHRGPTIFLPLNRKPSLLDEGCNKDPERIFKGLAGRDLYAPVSPKLIARRALARKNILPRCGSIHQGGVGVLLGRQFKPPRTSLSTNTSSSRSRSLVRGKNIEPITFYKSHIPMLRLARRGALGAAGVSAVSGAYVLHSDEGSRRSLKFWAHIFPIYAHYRSIQFLNRDMGVISDEYAYKLYDECHVRYTERVRDLTYLMRGFYLKQAQLMSTRHDFVPKEYMEWMKDTQDNVPSELGEGEAKVYCTKLMSQELGLNFDDVFTDWVEHPLGIASIGEVHRCKLKSTGQTVALKFQFPGMEERFRSDIKTIKSFCKLAMPQHVSAMDEIEKQFTTEFDYRGEAANLNTVRDNVMPIWGHLVSIPKPELSLCSKHLLTMEYLDGVKLVDGIRDQYKKIAAGMGKTFDEIEAEQKLKVQSGTLQFKTLQEEKRRTKVITLFLFLRDLFLSFNPMRFFYNLSPGRLLTGPMEYKWTARPIELGGILDLLSRVHAHEIFADGFFNGDCHPGNILLLKDGRLGLIDYGQVKRLEMGDRVKYAKLILALARDDRPEIVRLHFDELGTRTTHRREDIAYKMSCFYNDRDTPDLCDGMSIAAFMDWCEAEDPMVQLPEEFIFASRVSIMIRGMGNAFGLKLRMSQLWESEARKFLETQGIYEL